ncbi:MAG: phosphoribosylamine--glycine ligase [Thermoguttaceae bacterium]|nr:phosphoribosylamine--glycine ligase [Thermoguttaceae bacterium]
MNVLVIGSGGREHAIAWKLKQSSRVDRVFVASGNAGTASDAENIPIAVTDIDALVKFAKENHVGMTIVGPEVPLVAGLADIFAAENLPVFGPSKEAAELEGSKVFCKNLLRQGLVPTADFQTFSDAEQAVAYLEDREDVPVVVKADGLAAGKGVYVCDGREDAVRAVLEIGQDKKFGEAGNQIVIEERLNGQEASVLAITDGRTILTLEPAQDHKRAYDGDLGPNTGGMGAYCPTPVLTDEQLYWTNEHILVPTVHAMKRCRRPFRGVLYAGLMLTHQGPKVLEYNVRFGDPECQPILMRLKTDLLDICESTWEGRLDRLPPLEWDPRPAVCVVMAADGYPESARKGDVIRGLDEAAKLPNVKVFHAGTKLNEAHEVVTSGGRVLGVTAMGESIALAKQAAYSAVKLIRWPGAWCRKDISDKAFQKSSGSK